MLIQLSVHPVVQMILTPSSDSLFISFFHFFSYLLIFIIIVIIIIICDLCFDEGLGSGRELN